MPLRHSVKIDKQTQENLVRGRTVFVNPAEIAEDGNAGHIFAMKG